MLLEAKSEEFINVAIRIRPSLNVFEDPFGIKVISEQPPVLYAANRQSYTFNHLFTPNASQEVVYNAIVEPLVQRVLHGYNCTVFAYGQTGTGKTYTMGTDPKSYSDPGFIPQTFDEIFAHREQCKELKVAVSFYEIYNDKVFDLLSNTKGSLLVKGFKVEGLEQLQVHTSQEAQNLLKIGSKNRHVGETKLNANSSRSHAIFTVHCCVKKDNVKTVAKLNLVDLAGSESVRKTGNEGSQFQEGVNINIGLFNVRRVISALSANQPHVPYRESMITTILQDSLSRKNFVTLVACISPDSQDINESIQTLEFAQGAKKMKNKPEVNNVIEQFKKLNPVLFERPLLTNSTVKQRRTPCKQQNFSMECISTPSLAKQPKIINHTWTPMSTIQEPSTERCLPPISSPTFSPIVRKCVQALESTIMKKFDLLFTTIANKRNNTPKLEKQDITEIVRNELIQITGKKSRACSSPIESHNISGITPSFADDENVVSVARRLDFEDSTTKDTVPVRRSKRLSKLVKIDSDDSFIRCRSCKNSPPLPPLRKQAPTPAPRTLLHESIFKVPFGKAPKTKCVRTPRRRSKRLEADPLNRRRSARLQVVSEGIPAPVPRDLMKKHYNDILRVLNNEGEKELQKLPGIGPKSAAQIYFYRQLNGPFNRVEDLGKMKTWRGSSYKRFLSSNFLD